MSETILDLGGLLTAYAARSISQSLAPISSAAALARTINGTLVDLSDPAFRKYASTVSCTDHNAPALDGVWPGLELVVDCVAELARPTASPASRPVVPGSERVEGAFTFYRPRLTMLVVSVAFDADEIEASVAWQVELEEV